MNITLNQMMDVYNVIKGDLEKPDLVKENLEHVSLAIFQVKELFEDGFQWSDVGGILGKIIPDLMLIARDNLATATGAEKRQFVIDSFWIVYKTIDPDIKWIPEPLETMIEKFVICKMAESSIESCYKIGVKVGMFRLSGR